MIDFFGFHLIAISHRVSSLVSPGRGLFLQLSRMIIFVSLPEDPRHRSDEDYFVHMEPLSRLLDKVLSGEEIIIAKHGKPIAKRTALTEPGHDRIPGRNKNKDSIHTDFNDPLPDEISLRYMYVFIVDPLRT